MQSKIRKDKLRRATNRKDLICSRFAWTKQVSHEIVTFSRSLVIALENGNRTGSSSHVLYYCNWQLSNIKSEDYSNKPGIGWWHWWFNVWTKAKWYLWKLSVTNACNRRQLDGWLCRLIFNYEEDQEQEADCSYGFWGSQVKNNFYT